MTDDRLTAAEAARLAQQAQQAQAERTKDAIQPALDHAYAEIRQAATSPSGLTAVGVSVRKFNLTPDQQFAFKRALERDRYKVIQHASAPDVFDVGWDPGPTRRSEGVQLLRE